MNAKTQTKNQPTETTKKESTGMDLIDTSKDSSKDVSKDSSKDVSTTFSDELLSMLENESGSGQEDFGKEDKNMPYLILCQTNTPFLKKASEKYIEGAQEGDIVSTYNNKVYKSYKGMNDKDTSSLGVLIVPCAYTRGYYEFEIDNEGNIQKYINEHPINTRMLAHCEKKQFENRKIWLRNDNGHAIIDIAYHYVLVLDKDEPRGCYPCVLKLKGTNHEANKNLNTGISRQIIRLPNGNTIKPAMYHQIWKLYTIGRSDEKNSWCIYLPEFHDVVRDPIIAQVAKAFREEVLSGSAKPIDHTAGMEDTDDNSATAYADNSDGVNANAGGGGEANVSGGASASAKSNGDNGDNGVTLPF